MKNRQEIEMIFDEEYDGTSLEKYGFVLGYTKAQQDINESILDDLEMHILINEDDWSRNPQGELKDFINSLNKQS